MSSYRLYFRDRDGHFSGCRQFEAPATFEQSAEPTAWPEASVASCGGRAGFSDDGMTEQATVTSNNLALT
jgi:hypothetical protein